MTIKCLPAPCGLTWDAIVNNARTQRVEDDTDAAAAAQEIIDEAIKKLEALSLSVSSQDIDSEVVDAIDAAAEKLREARAQMGDG